MTQRLDLVDPDEFCRPCKGLGYETERTVTGGLLRVPCPFCRGTGLRTVRIDGAAPC